jgi:hypothetical protein
MRLRVACSGLVYGVVLASCAGGGSAARVTATTTTVRPIRTTTSVPLPTTTARGVTTSTTARPVALPASVYKGVFASAFAAKSPGLKAQMNALPTVAAVLSLTYDQANNVVRADIASKILRAGTPRSVYDNEAWYLMHGMSTVWWNPNAVAVWERYDSVNLLPALHLTLDDVWNYECAPDLMAGFAASKAGQNDFNAHCVK